MSIFFIIIGVISFGILLALILTTKTDDTQNDTCCYPSSGLLDYQKTVEAQIKQDYEMRKLKEKIKKQTVENEKERIKHFTDRQLLEEIHINNILNNKGL